MKPKCPHCSSKNCYARKIGDQQMAAFNQVITLKGYRCRRCGSNFNQTLEDALAEKPYMEHTKEDGK